MSRDRPLIEVQRICKTFGRHQALRNVDFHVHESEIVALIGPSGSGKSTLLKNIAGLSHADRRTGCCVMLRGEPIQRNGRLERGVRRRRAHIGYIFQQYNLVGRLSVLTNVLIGSLGRMPRWRCNLTWFTRGEKREALRALHRVGLERVALQRASTLSGGQQQRVAIARALMQEADVILADEPIASLDPQSARNVMEILAAINREDGKTVVVSLHQVEYARRYCERVLALKDGVIHFDSAVGNLSDKRLIDLYGPDILLAEDMDTRAPPPAVAARRREQAELAGAAL